jgi:hypothetical protein
MHSRWYETLDYIKSNDTCMYKMALYILNDDEYLAIEFLSAILLAKLDRGLDLVTVYREDILPGLDLSIKEQEEIFKILSRYYIDIKNKLRGVLSATAGL